MSMFRIENNFELLYSKKELCEIFYYPKLFKDMKYVTYSTEVFKTFKSDFKTLVSALSKLVDCDGLMLKERIVDGKFLFSACACEGVRNNTFSESFTNLLNE